MYESAKIGIPVVLTILHYLILFSGKWDHRQYNIINSIYSGVFLWLILRTLPCAFLSILEKTPSNLKLIKLSFDDIAKGNNFIFLLFVFN